MFNGELAYSYCILRNAESSCPVRAVMCVAVIREKNNADLLIKIVSVRIIWRALPDSVSDK